MNFIFVSPNFPVRYFKWAEALKDHGVNVLGIGDSPYFDVHPRLKAALTEYFFVADMSNFEDMKKAVAYFQSKYGKIDFIESDNEWWLDMDAKLRKEFNIDTGFFPEQMEAIKAKSAMKKYFESAGCKTMRYVLVKGPEDLDKAKELASRVGYPLFTKPNVGVGAADSFPLKDEAALEEFLSRKLPVTYIIEEYVEGYIVSFDGVCNLESDVVFCTTDHFPKPVAQVVNGLEDEGYYNVPFSLPMNDIDSFAFEQVGRKVVKAFGIKKRFFHIEFFVLSKDKEGLGKKGEFVGLECNMRPAGGYTPDLINYANSLSCYELYADIICYNENRQKLDGEKFYAWSSSRRLNLRYAHSEDEILEKYKDAMCMHGRYPAHMADAMGDLYYYARFKTYEEGVAFDEYVREKK